MIESAKIRTENARVVVDAVVDGVEHEAWVVYDGRGREYEMAALSYLHDVGCRFDSVQFDFYAEVEQDADRDYRRDHCPHCDRKYDTRYQICPDDACSNVYDING